MDIQNSTKNIQFRIVSSKFRVASIVPIISIIGIMGILSLLPFKAYAALAGYYQSAKEIQAILEHSSVINIFGDKGYPPIQSIVQNDKGYIISTGPKGGKCDLEPNANCIDNCRLSIDLVYETPKDKEGRTLVGALNFEIKPGVLECSSSSVTAIGSGATSTDTSTMSTPTANPNTNPSTNPSASSIPTAPTPSTTSIPNTPNPNPTPTPAPSTTTTPSTPSNY